MTAQGGDILAWIETAIAHRESEARLACHGGLGRWTSMADRGYSFAVEDEAGDVVVYNEGSPSEAQSDHISLNDPESVLRWCAADRNLLALHNVPSVVYPDSGARADDRRCVGCGFNSHEEPMVEDVRDCPTLNALAEGYGWTGGER